MLNFHRERCNPVKKQSKALVFFAVSKQIHIVHSADRGRAETKGPQKAKTITCKVLRSAIMRTCTIFSLYHVWVINMLFVELAPV